MRDAPRRCQPAAWLASPVACDARLDMAVFHSASSVLDPRLVERVAEDLGTSPGLVEKDWHVVRALGVIALVEPGGMAPAFSGGTSLSKGWELIKRFSEDIDFKVGEPPAASASAARRARSSYRERVLDALTGAGFGIEDKPHVGNENRFFAADLGYGAQFGAGQGLRPHIRIEVSFRAPAVPPIARPRSEER